MFFCAVCAPVPAAGAPSNENGIPSVEPGGPSLSPESASQLKNYEDWLQPYVEGVPFQPSMLDRFLHSLDRDNGMVEDAIEYPREWPVQWLDGVIPAYTGTG